MRNLKLLRTINEKFEEFITDNRGSHFVEVLVMILVVIIVGGLILTFSSNALDEIGPLVINKIKSLFSL